jgi:hypothetical protein
MKFNGLSMVLLLAAMGLGGWATYEQRQRRLLEAKLATVTQERDAYQISATKKVALQSKTDVKSDGPEGLGPDHAQALEEERKAQEKSTGPVVKDENPMAAMAEMMKDPAMKDVIRSNMRPQVDLMYRDLFDLLGLDETKQDQLSKILAQRLGAGMELGFDMMGGNKLTPEEKKQKTEAMKAATEASEKALKELLGTADYAKFDAYEKSQPERQQLSALNGQLKDKGLGLTEEAESQLMDAMYQERTNFKYDTDLSDQKNLDFDSFTEANLQRFQEQQVELRAKILERAGSILSPEQLEVFRTHQEQQAVMEKMGMEMGLKMMGGKKAEP